MGGIREESAEETRAYEQAKAAGANGTPEEAELAERKAARAHQGEAKRERWLAESGFAALLARAEGLLDALPAAIEEHRRAQATCRDLAVFLELARETPEDLVLARFARRAQDLAQQIARPPLVFENVAALRDLIAKVRGADLEGVNGPARNPNVATAWRRRFQELGSPLPGSGHAVECARRVKALLAEARQARSAR